MKRKPQAVRRTPLRRAIRSLARQSKNLLKVGMMAIFSIAFILFGYIMLILFLSDFGSK